MISASTLKRVTDSTDQLLLKMSSDTSPSAKSSSKVKTNVEVEEKEEELGFTGFTITEKMEPKQLKLRREDSKSQFRTILEAPRKKDDDKKESSLEVEELEGVSIVAVTHVDSDPFSRPEDVWCGVQFIAINKEEGVPRNYVLRSYGVANWKIIEPGLDNLSLQRLNSENESFEWKIERAEVVWEERGPYLKLQTIKEKGVIKFCPFKLSALQLKKFETGRTISPSHSDISTPKGSTFHETETDDLKG